MKHAEKDSVAEAQARVDVERARLNATITEIRRRADPRTVVEEVKDNAVHTATQFAGTASRLANAGVETVKRKPEVAGAAAGGVGLIAALFAWRGYSKRKKARTVNARIAERASVTEVLDPPQMNPFDGDQNITQPGDLEPAQQETYYAQEQHEQR